MQLATSDKSLKRGKGLSGPLQEAGVFPPMAVQMITVGEASGSLDRYVNPGFAYLRQGS